LAGGVVLAGGLVAFPAVRRFLRAGGWAAIRRRVAWAAGGSTVAGGALAWLGLGFRTQTLTQPNPPLAYWLWMAATTLALMVALRLWASAVTATAGRLDLSATGRTAEARLGVLTSNAAFVMLNANVILLAALQSSVPMLLLGVGGLATAGVRGRLEMLRAVGRARRPRRGHGPGRHVYRGGRAGG
jgi:hypothetical protein